ncbi:MAG: hypothetical protein IJG31_00210 [Fusobacterium sp.]|nr:hypothetical protein [Fusobacterium sp.]
MKKILLASFILLCSHSFSATGRSDMYPARGLELMRENNLNQLLDINGESGSLQTFETFFEKNSDVKSRGALLGTVSNFIANTNINAGLTVAYQKYDFENAEKRDREYALNTHLSYKRDRYVLIGGLGYAQAKEVSKRAYTGDIEIGYFSENQNFDFFDKGRLYYYAGINSNKWQHKTSSDATFLNYRLGVSSYTYLNRFRFVTNLETNADSKKYDKKRDKYNLAFSIVAGYYIYDDLLVELKYKGIKNKDFYNNLVSLGFTHTF